MKRQNTALPVFPRILYGNYITELFEKVGVVEIMVMRNPRGEKHN
jgi:hypothetical protein